MNTKGKMSIAAALAGVAILAGAIVGFRGRGLHPEKGDRLLGMKPSDKGFAVVELFTSEGCSSCPPADALVASVQKQDKDLPVYILAYHVDYWDRLGWKDAFSDAAYSDHQKEYAEWLRLSSIYTPQVVVNGQKEFVGSDGGALRLAVNDGLQTEPTARLSLSDVRLSGGRLSWQAHADAKDGANLRLVVNIVEHGASSKVMAGENSGRTLTHVQIVRGFARTTLNGKDASGQLGWPDGVNVADGEVIAFLQDTGNGKIVAATRSSVNK